MTARVAQTCPGSRPPGRIPVRAISQGDLALPARRWKLFAYTLFTAFVLAGQTAFFLAGRLDGGRRVRAQETFFTDQLATAFLRGQTSLSVTPAPLLALAPDPFDPKLKPLWYWDAALYQGRYYLYWGPAPALFSGCLQGAGRRRGDSRSSSGALLQLAAHARRQRAAGRAGGLAAFAAAAAGRAGHRGGGVREPGPVSAWTPAGVRAGDRGGRRRSCWADCCSRRSPATPAEAGARSATSRAQPAGRWRWPRARPSCSR